MRRAHQRITYGSRTLSSIELYLTSCCREETLQIEMALVTYNDDDSIDDDDNDGDDDDDDDDNNIRYAI